MDSKKVAFRECRDSEVHPNTVPVVLALDVTGSMHDIPKQLIADGLPKLMSSIIQGGCEDVALLFLAIGDHECDRYPIQVAQFESGDAELDMWLTRTYLEGGGGGNAGESYPLAWEFGANRVVTDAWEKRGEKGFLITIGDEPFLKNFPGSALKGLYGENAGQVSSNITAQELYKAASEKFNVYHISINHGRRAHDMWSELMGQNHITTDDYTQIPSIIAKLVLDNYEVNRSAKEPRQKTTTRPTQTTEQAEKEVPDYAAPAML